jgi:hypothetical protein
MVRYHTRTVQTRYCLKRLKVNQLSNRVVDLARLFKRLALKACTSKYFLTWTGGNATLGRIIGAMLSCAIRINNQMPYKSFTGRSSIAMFQCLASAIEDLWNLHNGHMWLNPDFALLYLSFCTTTRTFTYGRYLLEIQGEQP